MIIETESRKELERLVAVLSLGLCTAVESNCLSSEEAESYLFNPYSINLLQTVRASPELLDLVNLGTTMGTCERHFPEILKSNLSTMKSFALSLLQSQPRSSKPNEHWLQLRAWTRQENPIKRPLLSRLDELDALNSQHEEVTSADVSEQMYDAVYQSLIAPMPNYTLPVEFGMSSAEGNNRVREALSRLLNSPEVMAAQTQLQTPQERLEAFQDPFVRSTEGINFNEYFRYRAEL